MMKESIFSRCHFIIDTRNPRSYHAAIDAHARNGFDFAWRLPLARLIKDIEFPGRPSAQMVVGFATFSLSSFRQAYDFFFGMPGDTAAGEISPRYYFSLRFCRLACLHAYDIALMTRLAAKHDFRCRHSEMAQVFCRASNI